EQSDRRKKTLGGARSEQLPRLVQHEQRGQVSVEAKAADVEPPRLAAERRNLEQTRELVARVREIHELSARANRRALARREMVESRVERDAFHSVRRQQYALAQHLKRRVEVG